MKLIALSIPVDLTTQTESINATLLDGVTSIPLAITDDHPNWARARALVEGFRNQEVTADELAVELHSAIDLKATVEEKFVRVGGILDGRMSINGGHVTVDYEPVDPVLETHILRMLESSGKPKDAANWKAFSKFIENLYANTDDFVRKQLFGWMSYENLHGHGLTLTPDGCFIGYKGTSGTTENPVSTFAGHAIVDGRSMNGNIPNKVGSIIEMPRNEVTADPSIGCSAGLHVGTYDYASGWSRGVLLTVKVNPRDVVSVPVECNAQKIRTCRYEVIEVVEHAYEGVTYGYDEEDNDWDDAEDTYSEYDEDTCGDCDCEDDCEELEALFEEALDTDSLVRFDYVSKKGTTTRTVMIVDFNSTHLDAFEEESNGHRTFLLENILNAEILNDEADEDSAEDDDETCGACECMTLEDAVASGRELAIHYVDIHGEESVRTIAPRGIVGTGESARILGIDTDLQEFRSFLLSNVRDVKFANDPEVEEEISRNGYSDCDPWA